MNAHDHEASLPSRSWLDRVGIGVSIACAVHCVGTALLAAAPALAASAAPRLVHGLEWAEHVFLVMALGVGSLALIPSFVRHRRSLPLILFGAGLGVLVGAHLVELPLEGLELIGTSLGVACITAAHVLNLRASAGADGHAHAHGHAHPH
jgi:hypothetical protein